MEHAKCLSLKTPVFTFCTFRRWTALILVMFIAFQTVSALSVGEKTALQQILSNFQDLTSVAPWETLDQFGKYHGRSWNESFEDLCLIDGYDYYGIFCQNGQVVGLRVTNHWGFSTSKDFSASVGLVNLVNFTDETFRGLGNDLLSVLAQNVPLKNVDRPSLPLVNFSWPDMLESLSGQLTSAILDPFTNMTNLRRLKLLSVASYVDLSPLCNSSLLEIDLTDFNDSQLVELVDCLPTLEKVTFQASIPSDSDPLRLVSPSMTFLSLRSSVDSLDIDCPSLEYLDVSTNPNVQVNLTSPNLKHLTFSGALPASFTSLIQLETLNWLRSRGDLPLLSFAPNLKAISLESSTILNTDVGELLRSIPSTIQTISLHMASFNGSTEIISFPSHWTSLIGLKFGYQGLFGIDVFNVSSILELRTLEDLHYDAESSIDWKILYALTNLKKLSLRWQSPSVIPPDFFRRMPQLLDVTFNAWGAGGPIPWYGWENLQSASFSGYFSSWPALLGSASNLKTLFISTYIELFPTDDDFRAANLTNLVTLQLFSVSAEFFPSFWTDLPNLRYVHFIGFNFRGPVPVAIQAPMLSTLRFSATGLCGALPKFLIPTHLEYLDFSLSRFSGTIPASWEQNLSLRSLSLDFNPVTGTVPANLLTHHVNPSGMVSLFWTSLRGPLWNMSRGVPARLSISHTNLDICALDPGIVSEANTTDCSFDDIPKCPSRCPNYWKVCKPLRTPCTELLSPAPTPIACTAVNESCPLPQPGAGFQCNRGVWILLQNWSGPVTLPPNAGSVIVFGNIESNDTIVFSGTGTTIKVEGCVEKIEKIILELHSSESGNITLLTQLGLNCTKDLGKIPVEVIAPEIACQSFQAFPTSTINTLNVVVSFQDTCSVHSKSSPEKWIILGGSVGGVLIVFSIVFATCYAKRPGVRAFVRSCDIKKALNAK